MILIISGPEILVGRLLDFGIFATYRNDGAGEIDIEIGNTVELMRIAQILDMLGYE